MQLQKLFGVAIINVLILGLLPLTAHSQDSSETRQASVDVRNKIFKQILSDYKDLRECFEQQEGGIQAAQENIYVEEVDLNRDGRPEFEVDLGGCAGSAHNSAIYVYRQTTQAYEQILESEGLGLAVLKTYSNGYADVLVGARNNLASETESTYKFDGTQYRESKRMLVHLETGETKPASRRVQFKRGSSSTTVSGRASVVLPDTYVVGARAGQLMTVQLTAARKAVRFLLMGPTTRDLGTDNTRKWSGALPDSGDYIILVETDEESPSAYSVTITIK